MLFNPQIQIVARWPCGAHTQSQGGPICGLFEETETITPGES